MNIVDSVMTQIENSFFPNLTSNSSVYVCVLRLHLTTYNMK